ncbi:hypothetical protein [uncultured Nostoc sp.]|uniref:hypothetical protein n=1 Tax=uncultured Nostoc sp. TaxID=340711 RepID=UPI0035CBCC37
MLTEEIFNILWEPTNAYRCGETENLSTTEQLTAICQNNQFDYVIASASPLACPLNEKLEVSKAWESTGTIPS